MLRFAAEEQRILVTIGTDFGTLVYLGGAAHAGIIQLPDLPAPSRIALTAQILSRHGEANLAGAIGYRYRRPHSLCPHIMPT